MTGFNADPHGLQSTAPLYGSHARALVDIHDTLIARLEAEGECWGNDQPGRAFAAKYVSQAAKTLDQTLAVCGGLDGASDGLYRWGQNYLDADEAVQAGLIAQPGT